MAIQHLSYVLLFTTVLIAQFGLQPSDALCWPKVKFFDSYGKKEEDCGLKLPKALELKDLFKDKKDKDCKLLEGLLNFDDLKADFEDKKTAIESLFKNKEDECDKNDKYDKYDKYDDKYDEDDKHQKYDKSDKYDKYDNNDKYDKYDHHDKYDEYENVKGKNYYKNDEYRTVKDNDYVQPKDHYAPVPVKPYHDEKIIVKQVSYIPHDVTYLQKPNHFKPKGMPYVPKALPYVPQDVSYVQQDKPYIHKPSTYNPKPISYAPQAVSYASQQDLPYVQTQLNYPPKNVHYQQNDHAFYSKFLQNTAGHTVVKPDKLCECTDYQIPKPPCCLDVYYV